MSKRNRSDSWTVSDYRRPRLPSGNQILDWLSSDFGVDLSTGLDSAFRGPGSSTQTEEENGKMRGNSGITQQHDRINQYRRKKMPYRKKKKWIKFSKKVQAVAEKNWPTQILLRNYNGSIDTTYLGSAPRTQAAGTVASLYTANGEANFNDFAEIINMADIRTGLTTPRVNKYRVHITGTIMDLTLRNTSFYTSGPTGVLFEKVPLEVDLYLMVKYQESTANMTQFVNPNLDIAAGTNVVAPISGGGIAITPNTLGATPFELNVGAQGIKVLWKKKYFIGPGQTITLQHKNPKSFWISSEDYNPGVLTQNYFHESKNPLIWYAVAKLPPVGLIADNVTPTDTVQVQLIFGCTKRYTFRLDGAQNSSYQAL